MLNIIECERDGKRSIRSFILLTQKSDVRYWGKQGLLEFECVCEPLLCNEEIL